MMNFLDTNARIGFYAGIRKFLEHVGFPAKIPRCGNLWICCFMDDTESN